MIELRKISIGNMRKCIKLKLSPEQESFVSSNCRSLIDAFGLNRRVIGKGSVATPYVIYAHGIMVGFIMYGYFTKKFNSKHGEANYCYVSYEPTNILVRKWYKSLEFVETGEVSEGELVARLSL
ncbi:MAG: hypothetical protein FWE34_05930 [Defluviitaleaceae bacterium]|nr:hypothetical protein [Defluviitaleaceae bacterium]